VIDREGLKRELFTRIQAHGERATPALVERELARLERAQAALSAIEAVRNFGGTALYFSVDLRDSEAVAAIVDGIKDAHGQIDVLLHAAGIERSHIVADKIPAEFDLVFDVKANGWFNLLHAIGDMPLGATVAFCSIAGRFGNAGQTDYSSANDLLCKLTSNLRRTRPSTRGIAIDWTAWGGIGMASRGSIPKMMELAGIDMLPPETGVPIVRRELTMNDGAGEIVIANQLGVLVNEFDKTGGVDPVATERELRAGPMIGRIVKSSLYGEATIETRLDPGTQPFLYDHKIEGVPVLPGVMGIEAFAEAALCFAPGWQIEAIEDVNFLAPFKFYRSEPRDLRIDVSFYPENGHLVARCSLLGVRTLATQAEPQVTTHFTGCVRLVPQAPELITQSFRVPTEANVSAEEIYKIYFHGPAYRVVEQAWWTDDCLISKKASTLPANHVPPELPTLTCPRLIELCFQTAGLAEISEHQRLGLPLHVDSILISNNVRENGTIYARVTRAQQQSFDAVVVESAGSCLVHLKGYRTIALPGTVATLLKPVHAVMA
jgi:KR domain/Polyketide synthase dehydratase N-terminal domain/Polyketide synthase dehydratase domain